MAVTKEATSGAETPAVDATKTYLITGGAGFLGINMARY